MKARLYSIEEQQELILNESIKAAFLQREDIAALPKDVQEQRWLAHEAQLDELRAFFARTPGFVVNSYEEIEPVATAIAEHLSATLGGNDEQVQE